MQFIAPQQVLPAVAKSMLPAKVETNESKVVEMRLIAIIPPKVSGLNRPVDPEDLGNNVDVFV